jgi:tripeptide aminopeptidase
MWREAQLSAFPDALAAQWRGQQAWVLAQQLRVAAVPAPTGQEQQRALLMRDLLSQAVQSSLPISMDSAGNVVLRIDPTQRTAQREPALVCMAHLDTVFDAAVSHDPDVDGSLVRCPGIGDNGRGLAALLVLAHSFASPDLRARLSRPLCLVATVGEEGEGNLRGARAWFDAAESAGERPALAIAIDGPGDESIVHHGVGSSRLRVALRGAGGHSWLHAGAPNPLVALSRLVARAESLSEPLTRRVVVTAARMQGGEGLTSVPREAWVDFDVRSTDAGLLAATRRRLVQLAHAAAQEASEAGVHGDSARGLDVQIVALGERPAGALDQAHELVQRAARITEALGRTPRSGMASTDANVPLSRGIPAIAIGAGGRGGGAHTREEWYDDQNAAIGLERVLRVVWESVTVSPAASN